MKRRDFLHQSIAAGLLPLSGLRLDRLFDHQKAAIAEAERLHNKVLAAFDFGVARPAELWETTWITIGKPIADLDAVLANLQYVATTLKRGCSYKVTTAIRVNGYEKYVAASVRPGRHPKKLGFNEIVGSTIKIYRLTTVRDVP